MRTGSANFQRQCKMEKYPAVVIPENGFCMQKGKQVVTKEEEDFSGFVKWNCCSRTAIKTIDFKAAFKNFIRILPFNL
jgi:hypothetical protein